jgi:uncharacterized protein (DUF983 family)
MAGDNPPPEPSLPVALARGVRRRCPRCGGGGLFRRWIEMADDCPTCKLHFERVAGYWLGAIAVNFTVTAATFLVLLVGWTVLAWPDVPWSWLLVVGVAVTIAAPIAFHPYSRLLWVAVERRFSARPHRGA